MFIIIQDILRNVGVKGSRKKNGVSWGKLKTTKCIKTAPDIWRTHWHLSLEFLSNITEHWTSYILYQGNMILDYDLFESSKF